VAHAVNPAPYGANGFQGPKIKFVTDRNMCCALVYIISENF